MIKINKITMAICFLLIIFNTSNASAETNNSSQTSNCNLKSSQVYTSNEKSTIINIPDLNLKKVINTKLGKSKNASITKSELESIENIWSPEQNITNLEGLQYCINLKSISMRYNNISNLAPLSGLSKLEHIDISHNKITSTASLKNLKSLKSLYLEFNNINDIKSLGNIPSLEVLVMNDNKITNINALSKLTNLYNLDLGRNSITDISALSKLSNLTFLSLNSNNIQNVKLDGLKNLEILRLEKNKIVNLSLKNMPKLGESYSHLDLSGNKNIKNVEIINLPKASYINLSGNKINTITLKNLNNLSILDLSYNDISSLSGIDLSKSNLMYEIKIDNNKIINLKGIKFTNSKRLYHLDLSNNKLNDISSLPKIYAQVVLLNNNNITDISSLSKSKDITWLYLGNNKISNIKPLNFMKVNMHGGYVQLDKNVIDINEKNSKEIISLLKKRGYNVTYSGQVVKNLSTFKTFTVNNIKATSKTITGKGLKGATVKAYIGSKEIGKATVDSKGNYKISIKTQKSGTKITVKMSKSSYKTISKTKTVVNDKFTKKLTVNNIKSTSKTITGKGQNGATVKAYVGSKEIGKAKVDSKGNYRINISNQSKNKKVIIKMTKTGYSVVSISTTIK